MKGQFFSANEVRREPNEWGELVWLSAPAVTGARDLVVIEVTLFPGGGHAFHRHPQQEEVIYVLEGEVEQWLDYRMQKLRSGDSAFIPVDMVHASFNRQAEKAQLLAILGPCIGEEGYELVDVASEEPWLHLMKP